MKILFLSAEVGPYVSVGGLSQVMYFLPKSLLKLNLDVRIFTPRYGVMNKFIKKTDYEKRVRKRTKIKVPINKSKYIPCSVAFFRQAKSDAKVYFLENREYYNLRTNVFGYTDDHIRFGLFSKAYLEFMITDKFWKPDIIHCHDWHSSYFIELARKDKRYASFLHKTPIVLTVHNFRYQGVKDFRYLSNKDCDTGKKPLAPINSPKLRNQNALLRGIEYADAINTVSPSHAIEVLTPEYAEGLDNTLNKARGKLSGILNGLDTKEFNPATDPIIKKRFTSRSFIKARAINKENLQKEFSLAIDANKPLIAYSGRLSSQKGLDLVINALPHLLREKCDLQFIILGGGDDRYRKEMSNIRNVFPNQVSLHMMADFRLPRKIFAGADILLIPSLFEPGGIVALEALRYGAVPLVRKTGGLSDIVQRFNTNTAKGNGFAFDNIDPWSLFSVIIEALTIHKQTDLWHKLVKNCMLCDFSWDKVAVEYNEWYKRVIVKRKRAVSKNPHPAYA